MINRGIKRKVRKSRKTVRNILLIALLVYLFLVRNGYISDAVISKIEGIIPITQESPAKESEGYAQLCVNGFDFAEVPPYTGSDYVVLNNNVPYFTAEEKALSEEFQQFSDLDNLGRCGTAFGLLGYDMMPTEERGSIGMVKPSGWHIYKWEFIDGKYLYNRCHLIGYQMTGENANELNLITGTRWLNVVGMLPFENEVASFMRLNNDMHLLYRVTPVFVEDELVARGVLMEAYSLEDAGQSVQYCVFCYNIQPGVEVDYATGEAWLAEES